MIALVSGLRSSQLYALTLEAAWTVFSLDGFKVSLAPSSAYLSKNEKENNRLQPVVFPAWFVSGVPYHLCPVTAPGLYLQKTVSDSPAYLLVWPTSLIACSRRQITSVLCSVIEEADPGKGS